MEFEWDANKDETNFRKHGITFSEAAKVFGDPLEVTITNHNNITMEDEMRPEYDFSNGGRGKHFKTYRQGTNLIPLAPDVAKKIPDAAAVNEALRLIIKLAKQRVQS